MTLDFFKQKYGHEVENMWMPRVTAITSFVSKNNFLGMRAGTDWGTMVHEAIEKLLKGQEHTQDPRLLPSVNAFVKWQRTSGFEVLTPKEDVERLVVDQEHVYAGTVDALGRMRGTFGLIDLKTSSAIREEYALQTAAYLNAYNRGAEKQKLAKARWILRIDQYMECKGCFAKQRERDEEKRAVEGNPLCNHVWSQSIAEVEFKEQGQYGEDLEAFLSAKEVWEWYHRDWLRRVPNYPKKIIQKVLL